MYKMRLVKRKAVSCYTKNYNHSYIALASGLKACLYRDKILYWSREQTINDVQPDLCFICLHKQKAYFSCDWTKNNF